MDQSRVALFVEDDPSHAILLRECLPEHWDYRAHFVTDGAQALDYIFHKGEFSNEDNFPVPKIIFLDLRMPSVDGFGVLNELRLSNQHRRIPVIILTTSESDSDKVKAMSLGAKEYIVKPWEIADYRSRIVAAVQKWTGDG